MGDRGSALQAKEEGVLHYAVGSVRSLDRGGMEGEGMGDDCSAMSRCL